MKDNKELLKDMLKAIVKIQSYTVATYSFFLDDEKAQDSIMYNQIILGEDANQIPYPFQISHPEIPWSFLIGLRDVIVHSDDQGKAQIVWDFIQEDLLDQKKQSIQIML